MTFPGWYVDPVQTHQLRWWDGTQWAPWLAPRPPNSPYPVDKRPLDTAVEAMRIADPEPWGTKPVLIPLLTYVVLIVTTSVVVNTVAPKHGTGARVFDVVANIVIEGALGVAIYYAGRDVARRNGGWGNAFGLRRPRWRDLLVGLAGLGIAFGARIVVGIVAAVATNGRALTQANNLHVHSATVFTGVLLVLTAVIAAPFVEELVFRGLLLRTFMRRMSFWPAALISTTIFGLGHTYEVSTLEGAITLAFVVGSLGLTNCLLNRRTDRLVPGMLVHATSNGLAVLVLLLGHAS